MKKSLVALAALAAVGAASAQVTIYGTVDAGYTSFNSGSVTVNGLGNSQMSSSKFGFMGTEDLGGGLKANFKLEGGLANDTGNGKASNTNNQTTGNGTVAVGNAGNATLLSGAGTQGLVFQRFSYVGVSGDNFGEVRLGRDYTNTFLSVLAATDPFETNGFAGSNNMALALGVHNLQATVTNASNLIGYTSPTFAGGFGVGVQAYFGEVKSNAVDSGAGDGYSVLGKYAAGPVYVAVGQQVTKGTVLANAATAATATANASFPAAGDYTVRSLTGSYDAGVVKGVFTYSREELVTSATTTASNTSNLIAAIVPFGATRLKASYIRSAYNTGVAGTADTVGTLLGLGVDYALSKRTTVYGTYARTSNDSGATAYYSTSYSGAGAANNAAGELSSTGYAIGLKHTF